MADLRGRPITTRHKPGGPAFAADGDALRKSRVTRGLSIEDLSRATGLSWVTIYRLEAGRVMNARAETIAMISEALGVSMESLMRVENVGA